MNKNNKKSAAPDTLVDALVLRAAGFTILSISQRTGIGIRTLQRHFSKHGAVKGELMQELIDAARAELLKRVTSDDTIREEAAKLINDDLAHAKHIRGLILNASERLTANTLQEAALVMRASAAYSTVIKNTSDTIRRTLRIERVVEESSNELPELVIRELSAQEIEEIRRGQFTHERTEEPVTGAESGGVVVTH